MPQAAAGAHGGKEAGALFMTHAEHLQTRTYGSKGIATVQPDAKLSFPHVLAKEVCDVRRITGSKYNEGLQKLMDYCLQKLMDYCLQKLMDYYRQNFPHLMKK
jgi:hypothetical protein